MYIKKNKKEEIQMIGIYKITNKLNNKSYIGQSINCEVLKTVVSPPEIKPQIFAAKPYLFYKKSRSDFGTVSLRKSSTP